MSLQHISIEEIDEAILVSLITSSVVESKTIEYKRDSYGSNDDQKQEYLADISSLANTSGGDLFIGIAAQDGVPTNLSPLSMDKDQEKLRLESIARDGIEPRINGLQIHAVDVSGGYVMIIRVPKSYNPPHRIIFKGKNRFWARSSAGKYEPDTEELRFIFTQTPLLSRRMEDFRFERIAKIATGSAQVGMNGAPYLTIHVIPFSAFDMSNNSILSLSNLNSSPNSFPPIYSTSTNNWTINFDGFISLSNVGSVQENQRSYVQVFRNGIVEAVASNIGNEGRKVSITKISNGIVSSCLKYINSLVSLEFDVPFCIFVSLLGVNEYIMLEQDDQGSWLSEAVPRKLDSNQLHFMECIIQLNPLNRNESIAQLRNILDQIANAGGLLANRI